MSAGVVRIRLRGGSALDCKGGPHSIARGVCIQNLREKAVFDECEGRLHWECGGGPHSIARGSALGVRAPLSLSGKRCAVVPHLGCVGIPHLF